MPETFSKAGSHCATESMNKKHAAAAVGGGDRWGVGSGGVNGVGRPSLRSLAALAGVTSMTVSLALRDHPSISSATRTRLKKLAAKHGYRPDPTVAKLMHHLRTRRTERTLLSLCGLRLRPPVISAQGYDYGQQVCTGARGRAETLGFRFEEIFIDEPGQSLRRLQKVLTSRGGRGSAAVADGAAGERGAAAGLVGVRDVFRDLLGAHPAHAHGDAGSVWQYDAALP
jgi:hypothetical protein